MISLAELQASAAWTTEPEDDDDVLAATHYPDEDDVTTPFSYIYIHDPEAEEPEFVRSHGSVKYKEVVLFKGFAYHFGHKCKGPPEEEVYYCVHHREFCKQRLVLRGRKYHQETTGEHTDEGDSTGIEKRRLLHHVFRLIEENTSELSTAGTLAMDGTFSITPGLWKQTYVIFKQVPPGAFVPLVICLMTNKSAEAYHQLFTGLANWLEEHLASEWQPDRILTDFEASIRLAFRVFFGGLVSYNRILRSLAGVIDKRPGAREEAKRINRMREAMRLFNPEEPYNSLLSIVLAARKVVGPNGIYNAAPQDRLDVQHGEVAAQEGEQVEGEHLAEAQEEATVQVAPVRRGGKRKRTNGICRVRRVIRP
ncbi:unnamed protein product [Sphagnum compactum]